MVNQEDARCAFVKLARRFSVTLSEKSSKSTSGLNDDNAGVTPSGTSSNRNGPRKIGSSAWSARWPNSAENRKPLNSVPESGNSKRTGGAWCVCFTMPPVIYTCSVCSRSMPSMRNSSSLEESPQYHNPYVVLSGACSYGLHTAKHALAVWPRQQTSLAVRALSALPDG